MWRGSPIQAIAKFIVHSIESEIPIRFYYDQGACTALLPFHCYDSCHLTKISNRSGIAVQWNGGGGRGSYIWVEF